jgi:GTP-binding protein EngB required for normal cell division
MSDIILEGPIADIRERETRLLIELGALLGQIGGEGGADRERLQRSASDLRDMFFLVVVIGEFNAGKSSFVNAMIGDSLLEVGPIPTTEAIQLIRYAPVKSSSPQVLEEGLVREWQHPNIGTQGVVVVDTPGTGSVFEKHERIAKDFLSRSDLVIFLMSAKRAFAQTEKLYLELAQNYGKKVLMVINQVDLLEDKELQQVKAFVRQQVSELLSLQPPLFLVSAKKALARAEKSGLLTPIPGDDSGIDEVKRHLISTFRQTPPAKQKLLAQMDLGETLLKKHLGEVNSRLNLLSSDEQRAKELETELEKQAEAISQQLGSSMKEIERVFAQMRARGRAFIAENLSLNLGDLLSLVQKDREVLRKKFEEEVVGSALQEINTISEDYSNAVVDGGRRYWASIIERLRQMQEQLDQIPTPDSSSYADQRLTLQEAISQADEELKSYQDKNLALSLNQVFSSNLSNFRVGLGSIIGGIISAILAFAVPGALGTTALSVIGIAIAPVLVLGGGALAYRYWDKLQKEAYTTLDQRLDDLKKGYYQALEQLTQRERSRLLQQGKQILQPVFSRLGSLADTYRQQQAGLESFKAQLAGLRQDLDRIQITST